MNNSQQAPYTYQNPQYDGPQGAYNPDPGYGQQYYAYPPYAPEDPLKPVKKRCTRTGIAVLCAVAAMYVFIFIFTIIYTVLGIFGLADIEGNLFLILTELASCVGAYVLAPLTMWLIMRKMPYRAPEEKSVTPLRIGKWILIAFGIDMGISMISSLILNLFGTIFGSDFSGLTTTADVPWYITLLTTVIIAPIVEEIMFRRILLRRLLPDGELYAIVISGLAFGLFHMNFYQFFYAAALGFLFALIIVKTGKLWHTIALHMAINFLASVETMWLSDLPGLDTAYTIFLLVLMAAGIVILVIDVIKKDGGPEQAAFPKMNGNWRAAVKSGGMITCWAVLGAFSLIMTIVMLVIY